MSFVGPGELGKKILITERHRKALLQELVELQFLRQRVDPELPNPEGAQGDTPQLCRLQADRSATHQTAWGGRGAETGKCDFKVSTPPTPAKKPPKVPEPGARGVYLASTGWDRVLPVLGGCSFGVP